MCFCPQGPTNDNFFIAVIVLKISEGHFLCLTMEMKKLVCMLQMTLLFVS